jgi:hypothetical protein
MTAKNVRYFIGVKYDQVIIRFLCEKCFSPEDIQAHLDTQFGYAAHSGRSV